MHGISSLEVDAHVAFGCGGSHGAFGGFGDVVSGKIERTVVRQCPYGNSIPRASGKYFKDYYEKNKLEYRERYLRKRDAENIDRNYYIRYYKNLGVLQSTV